jgi:hypothetical protein
MDSPDKYANVVAETLQRASLTCPESLLERRVLPNLPFIHGVLGFYVRPLVVGGHVRLSPVAAKNLFPSGIKSLSVEYREAQSLGEFGLSNRFLEIELSAASADTYNSI